MPINVNCTSFRQGGDCLHQAAPRRWFGPARCIVWLDEMGANTDPRQVRTKCALCTPHQQPQMMRPVMPQAGWSTVEGVPTAQVRPFAPCSTIRRECEVPKRPA